MSEWPRPKKVFLDADIVIREGRPSVRQGTSLTLDRLKDLVDAGVVTVLTTDLTCWQVAKKRAEEDHDIVKEVGRSRFREIIKEVMGTNLPETTKRELQTKLVKFHVESTKMMFKALGWRTLTIEDVKPSTVFSAYTFGEGFFTDEGKKDQFADAFIFECLKLEASSEEPVIIVSGDGDFDTPVKGEDHISLVKSLPELLETFGLQVDQPEMLDFLELHRKELVEAVNDGLDYWDFIVDDVDDAEIEELSVTEIEETELTNVVSTKEGGPILVVGMLSVKADISYSHPDWDFAIWDSEDKRYLFLDDAVKGETQVSFDMEVSILVTVNKDGSPEAIKELRIDDRDYHVNIYDSYP